MHQHVVERIREYGIVYRGDVQEMLDRAAPYWPLIRLALQTHGVPEYFGYLPFVESAFQVDARHSRSGAAGLWQLMRSTARTYGLRVTKEIDERFEPTRATTAAVRYLRDLQAMFGPRHPLLTVAAYNYGEYNLSKAIARTRTRDIWRLVRLHQLPDQTREYLIRTIAVWVVVAHAERFGLRMDFPEQPLSYLELTFDKPIVLAELAQQLQVSSQHLRAMNPHLLVEQVPSLVPIHVPAHVLQMPKQVEVRLAPQALQKKTCCARLHLLTPAEAVELALPAAGIASKPVSFPRPPTPETPVLATVPQ
jgi:membrane-bound lytic murein transglycosylase D